jgi:hypothetical protein
VSYQIGPGAVTYYIPMTRPGSDYDTWTFDIPEPAGGWGKYENDFINVTFEVNDRLGNTITTSEYRLFIEKAVSDPLIINHIPIKNQPHPYQEG